MESVLVNETPPAIADNADQQNTESAENFQTFIYDLFDQNGILNDLRAYLRGHIVNVLKSAQTGDSLPCQKHFTQRLELANQALNILVAEYLLRLEFNYSLSVFVSEIPLANMVFAFAKTLMLDKDSDHENLKFVDHDVWRILNYLGVKCDSQHASNIINMYKSEENPPLLLCILKGMPLYNRESVHDDPVNSSEESTTSSVNSSDSHEGKHAKAQKNTLNLDECKHYVHCKTCQNKVHRVKEKYRSKKRNFAENTKECNLNSISVECFLKSVSAVERSLIDEMFQQLKTVYEAEVDMLKCEEENRIRRYVANHATRLQKQRDEMEERFKARQEELERNVQQKKKFLWGLARALRDQHAHMMKAMNDVKTETMRLTAKEDSLKTQLADAEQLLKQRGEEMRNQISNELVILEKHLESMKQERDNINKERTELEQLKNITDSNNKLLEIHNIDSEEVKNHYELLKNEFTILKKYLEATKLRPKCVIERSTLTDLNDISSRISVTLNNSHEVGFVRNDDDKLRSNQVVNDLKKQKNVNFSQSNLDEIYHERSRDRSRSSASSEAGDANFEDSTVRHLSEENERLKTFARQQREHIDELLSERARLQVEMTATQFRAATEPPYWRPRTAPTVMPRHNYYVERLNSSASATPASCGWRLGGGEELSLFSDAHPRVLIPGDELPFIGVLKERNHDYRRRLINQWRILRRRFSPLAANSNTKIHSPAQRDEDHADISSHNETTTTRIQDDISFIPNDNKPLDTPEEMHPSLQRPNVVNPLERPKTAVSQDVQMHREKSPKSIIREAKQNLRNKKDTSKDQQPQHSREKSPNSVLREAKLRLRKLEIEAEAVEQSYLEFKKRQSQVKEKRSNFLHSNETVTKDIVGEIDAKQSKSIEKLEKSKYVIPSLNKDKQQSGKIDFEKYLKEYKANLDIGVLHFKNRDTAAVKVKPIPETYRNVDNVIDKKNYLETPLNEFRKLYVSTKKPLRIERTLENQENLNLSTKITVTSENNTPCRKDLLKKAKDNKRAEFEILKQNIGKIYDLNEDIIDDSIDKSFDLPLSNNDPELKIQKPNQIELECSLKFDKSKEKSDTLKATILSSPVVVTHHCDSEFKNPVEIDCTSNLKTNNEIIVSPKSIIDKNVPTVDVDSVSEVNVVDDNQYEMLAAVNSSDNRHAHIELDSSLILKRKNENLQSEKSIIDKNSPRVDVEGVSEVNVVDDTQIETAVNNRIVNRDAQESNVDEIRPQMTIIVSPKIPKDTDDRSPKPRRSVSPEQAAKLTRNDVLDAIFHKDDKDHVSSTQMQLELSNDVLENSVSDFDKDEYRDEFSADVDNYNSKSDYENEVHSPVSILKTSEDENFWE